MNLISPSQAIALAADAYVTIADIVGPNPEHPIRVHFHEIDGVFYIVLEGSKTRQDCEDNLRAWLRLDLPTIFHGASIIFEGFYYSCYSVKDEIGRRIAGRKFCIIGHSRGGAQASPLAKLLSDDGLKAEKIYIIEPARAFAFGLPSIFQDPALPPDASKIAVWGCWNGNDPVPHLPLGDQFMLDIIGKAVPDRLSCHHLDSVAAAWAAAQGAKA